jgi:predicted site-specific integrase-resolvase
MVNEKPNVPPTARYSLREAAKILGVNAKTISRAIERGVLRCGYRKMNNMPYVEGKEIMRMWQESW